MANPNGKTVLVVEDETSLRNAVSDILLFEGFNVIVSADGKDGFAQATKYQPDLILLDLVMPVMGGWAMLEKVRKHGDWGASVPVFLLTNVGDDIGDRMRDSHTDYLPKSNWVLEDVVKKIKGRLGLETN
jgi:CheY-like chemotaxis protein